MTGPIGELLLTSDGDSLTGVYVGAPLPGVVLGDQRSAPVLTAARRQLDAWFAGDLRAFDLPTAPAGTPFQCRVWAAVRAIPYGSTSTYGAVALAAGATVGAAMAVGSASARNPLSIVVPCHRLTTAAGRLRGGPEGARRKEILQEFERRALAST
ncbi:methylated-DNA--[protein]-cysteine S-methyltransferase [Nakamurella flavida]|nr:methylated-DNA--[protein]-cysteine S-methyltransferase [Nakamurella flavida]